MFLDRLNRDMQEGFLELAYNMAISDYNFDDTQKRMMATYEAEVDFAIDYVIKPIEEIFAKFENADDVQKKSIYVEALAVAMSNDRLDTEEVQILEFIEEEWGFDEDYRDKCETVLHELNLVYEKIAGLF